MIEVATWISFIRSWMVLTLFLQAVDSIPTSVLSGPRNLVYHSTQLKNTDAICESAFQPWTSEKNRAWHQAYGRSNRQDIVPVVRSELAVAYLDRNLVTFRCSDARGTQVISQANESAGRIVEVRDVYGFSLVCTDFESPETRRVIYGRRGQSTRSMGLCRPKTFQELEAVAAIQRKQVESGMTQCIDLNVEPVSDSVTAWTSTLGSTISNQDTGSWVVASDFQMYELGTAMVDAQSFVYTVQLPVDKRGSRTYRACAHIETGRPNAMLHMGAFSTHMIT